MSELPQYLHTVLDAVDARELAEFYKQFLGLHYRPGDEPGAGSQDDPDWLVLVDSDGTRRLAFQRVAELPRSTWPAIEVPMQMHIDFTVGSAVELDHHLARALSLGGTLLLDRRADVAEPLVVIADPAGHPFCVFVH